MRGLAVLMAAAAAAVHAGRRARARDLVVPAVLTAAATKLPAARIMVHGEDGDGRFILVASERLRTVVVG